MPDTDGWKEYPAVMGEYEKMRDDIMTSARALGLSEAQEVKLELGIEEMLVNIINYAYDGTGFVWIQTAREGDFFRMDFVDYGKPFDPLEKDMRHPDDVPIEEREEGGFGIFLVREFFDKMQYAYEDFEGKKANHLSLWLKIK